MNKVLITKVLGILIAITALADTQFELLKAVGITPIIINWLKVTGLIVALVLPSLAPMKTVRKYKPKQ